MPTASGRGATAAAPGWITAVLMVVAGVLDIVGAFLPALVDDVEYVEKLVPFHVHHVAGVLGILAGVALIGLALPVLRGYRPAYLRGRRGARASASSR